MTAAPTPTAWASRPAVPAALSHEELAALLDRSGSAHDGLLFTATPAAELDEIGRWQKLKDQAWAGQVRAIVAAFNRASKEQRQFAGDEVGLAIGATSTTGGNLVAQALAISELPGLLEAVEAGLLTERHVLAVLRELDGVELTIEQRGAVVLVMLARFTGQAPGELGGLVRRLIMTVDRAAAAAREQVAARKRRVRFSGDVDGQAMVVARGPAEKVAAIRAALEATLTEQPEPEDERSRDEREFDLFVELLTGGEQAGSWQAEVSVPFSAASGGDLALAEIPGLGPILPSTARDLLGRCDKVRQIAVDEHGQVIAAGPPTPGPAARPTSRGKPEPGFTLPSELYDRLASPPTLEDLDGSAYEFPPRLRRFLEARDQTCVFPGCSRPAHKTHKDHRIPWPLGRTTADNGACLCPHHHRAKHAVFRLTRDACGCHRWTTRGGWQFFRRPKGY